jgi:hypothetical protein
MNETQLRDLLREKADAFSLDDRIPTGLRRRGRNRTALAWICTALAGAIVLASSGVIVIQASRQTPLGRSSSAPAAIDLLDYYEEAPHQDRRLGGVDDAQHAELKRHAACMRHHGFDLPDPTREGDGWSILVDDPKAIGFDTPEWREAAFVDCRPMSPRGRGDLIVGLGLMSRAGSDEFRACMAEQGFSLPPARSTDEHWRFDLTNENIDLESREWNRAIFVTCWIGRWN